MVLLRRALVPHGGATSSRVLIRWTSAPSHLDTWEAEDDHRRRFPSHLDTWETETRCPTQDHE